MDVDFYLIKYEKGELVSSPFQNEILFQIVEQGSINIYFIRDDGTRYSLSNGTSDYFLGDMDIFYPKSQNIYAEAAPASLTERVLSYMKYKCSDGTLKGIGQAAFHLHCSTRQLQRILNQSETAGLVKKIGKGTYQLTENKY